MPGKFLFFVLLGLNLIPSWGQIREDRSFQNSDFKKSDIPFQEGTLTIHQDNRMDLLLNRYKNVTRQQNGMWGYRIQIYFGSGRKAREEAYEAKAKFLSDFANIPAYVLYQTPFYKVRIGDFRTKREAYALYKKVRRKFSDAYITPPEIIRLPPIEKLK